MTSFPELVSQGYSISVREFLGEKPTKMEGFDWKRVTRANFMSWYETSFRVSQGLPQAQLVFYYWCEANLGFDFKTSLQNFSDASSQVGGNWNFLTKEEQQHFLNAYQNVEGHVIVDRESNGIDVKDYTTDGILDRAEGQTGWIEDDYLTDTKINFPMLDDLKGMAPDKFKTRINSEIKAYNERVAKWRLEHLGNLD